MLGKAVVKRAMDGDGVERSGKCRAGAGGVIGSIGG